MKREQKGSLYRRGAFWILRYRETFNTGGQVETRQRAVRLCLVDQKHKTKRSVWQDENICAEIERILAPQNDHRGQPETLITLAGFVNDTYLPFVEAYKRASTFKGYRDMWQDHVSRLTQNVLLRNVRTVDLQRWLETIAAEDRTPKGTRLSHESLKHIKSLLSGIFAHAKRQGFFDGANPVQNTAIPPAPKGAITYAYSRAEVNRMILVTPEPAATILAVAAYTGARRGEIEALRWEDWRDGGIYVSQSAWNGQMNEPKTRASAAPIPVVPFLAGLLEAHRERLGHPTAGPMFPAGNGEPASLNNVLNRTIKPALNRCEVCRKAAREHVQADHDYKRDSRSPEWHGWHAFRRGVATNLHDLGVDDKTIQAILRHSDVSVTQRCYIKTLPAQSVAAMNALESALCAERAPGAAVSAPATVN